MKTFQSFILNLSIFVCIIFNNLYTVYSTCAYTQDCSDPKSKACFPFARTYEPEKGNFTNIACPEYNGKATCCNTYQHDILGNQLILY